MLTGLSRRLLPAPAQDFLRTVRDELSPSRRAGFSQQKANDARTLQLAAKVSPEGRILSGIFEGMWMPFENSWGGLSARLVGSYEEELSQILRVLIAEAPPVVIDAGSADGYYAVGFARALPRSTVYAFDIDREARRVCRLTAARNGVHNLHVRGRIDPRQLRHLLIPNALVMSDVEGYETTLLDPRKVPGLRQAAIVVELHEWIVPGSTSAVLARFGATHEVELIDSRQKDPTSIRQTRHLSAEEAHAAVEEGRPHPQQWAVMRPLYPHPRNTRSTTSWWRR